jgi:hypothetical protein
MLVIPALMLVIPALMLVIPALMLVIPALRLVIPARSRDLLPCDPKTEDPRDTHGDDEASMKACPTLEHDRFKLKRESGSSRVSASAGNG